MQNTGTGKQANIAAGFFAGALSKIWQEWCGHAKPQFPSLAGGSGHSHLPAVSFEEAWSSPLQPDRQLQAPCGRNG